MKKGNEEIHRLRHHSSMKLFLPTAENEKAHNLWIKLTFTKCQCLLDRQGWLKRFNSKLKVFQVLKKQNTKFNYDLSFLRPKFGALKQFRRGPFTFSTPVRMNRSDHPSLIKTGYFGPNCN